MDLLERSGEALETWPEELRLAAQNLLRDSPEARAALADMQVLRRALKSEPVKAPAGLARKIASEATQPTAENVSALPAGDSRKLGSRSDR